MRRLFATALVLGAAIVWSGCATGITYSEGPVSEHDASLRGFIVSDVGTNVEHWFEYGRTTAYGSETEHITGNIRPYFQQLVAATATGLTKATVYHYRLCAKDPTQQGGPGCGADEQFKTQSFACGDTITTDLTLSADLDCDLGGAKAGITVGAPGIVIDLGGHRFYGDFFGDGAPGIDNTGGYDDVTIRNGVVYAWGNSIAISGADRNRIARVTTSGLGHGIQVTGGTGLEIRHSNVGGGVLLRSLSDAVVADSPGVGWNGAGALVLDGVSNTRVVRNHVLFGDTGDGIAVSGNGNLVRGNLVDEWLGAGIAVLAGSGNRVVSNELDNNSEPDPTRPGDGIFVGAFTARTLIRDNFAHNVNDDGIEVDAPDTRIGGNRANDNHDLGIDAVAGVTDLGGNTASGNGNPLQCVNVFCQ